MKNINDWYNHEYIPNEIKQLASLEKKILITKLDDLFKFYENENDLFYYINYILEENFFYSSPNILVPYLKNILNNNNILAHRRCFLLFSYTWVKRDFLDLFKNNFINLINIYGKNYLAENYFSPKYFLDIIEKNLPKDKYDFEAIEFLRKKPKEELKKLIPDLAFWLDDSNSPIYGEIAKLLSSFQNELIPAFLKVFEKNDYTSKSNCLMFMCNYPDKNAIIQIKDILERFANDPTQEEIEEDIHLYSKELLEKIK